MKLLVTGGTGLVGHALQKIKPDAIYVGSKDFDLTKESDVKKMFDKYQPTHLIHLAAKVGGIKDNIEHQADFYYQNIMMNTLVLHYAYKYKVKKLLATISNCAYPDVAKKYPLLEEQLYDGPPAKTNFSYGLAKRMLDVQIKSYNMQYNCNFIGAIPCSIYGPYDEFSDGQSHFLAALIKKIYNANKENKKELQLFGTGKPLRQYIYSEDLAKIIIKLLNEYEGEQILNIAPKENLSIKEIAQIALKSTDSTHLKLNFDSKFPDGQFRKDLGSHKLFNIIGNFEFTSLSVGIKKTYEWYKQMDEVK